MRARIFLAAGIVALAVLTAAGCGGGSTRVSAGAGGALGGAAAVAPADTVALVALDSDLGSSQWQALDGLLAKIPQHDKLVTELQKSFEQQTKLSWANDVKPALGPEVDVVVLPAVDGKAQVALLTQPADPSKLDALLQKAAASGRTKPVSTQVDGWTAISDSQTALDALKGATSHLADDAVYQEASGRLASDALVRVYANGAEAEKLVASLAGKTQSASTLVWASADAVAESGGLRVHGFARTSGQTTEPYASALVAEIPSGALLVADFQARHETSAGADSGTSKVPLGGDLRDLGAALGGETAVYLSPGVPLPSVTLVTESSDPQKVLDSLGKLLGGVGSLLGGASSSGSTGGLDLGGILSGLHLVHEQVGSRLVVSTSQQAIDAFKAAGDKLASDGTFQEARTASGMPDKTTGFLYVNAKDLLPAAQALLSLSGGKAPGTGVDLSAVRTFTAYGSGASGGVESFTAFLEVK